MLTRFLPAFLLPFLAVYATVGWTHGRYGVIRPAEWAALALLLIVLTSLSAFCGAAMLHMRWPRRWLLPGAPGRRRAMILGILAGAGAIGLSAVAIYYVNRPLPGSDRAQWEPGYDERRLHDGFVLAPACLITSFAAVWLMPRRRPGACLTCGYDIRFSLDSGRCPECGRAIATD